MFCYECHICGGSCDSGELENGVCFDCRREAVQKQKEKDIQTIMESTKMIRARYAEPSDSQTVMTAN